MPLKSDTLPDIDYTKPHRCGRRGEIADPNGVFKILKGEDTWRTEKDGTHTCSYCGSLSEKDFFNILENYSLGVAGYRFDRTDKSYKFYANRPNVLNASEGGIKFYTPHGDFEHDIEVKNEIFNAAQAKYTEEWNKRFPSQT